MVSSLGVSIGSLLCSLAQVAYIVAILWMLRVRQRRLRQSMACFPAPPPKQPQPQPTPPAREAGANNGPGTGEPQPGATSHGSQSAPADPAAAAGADALSLTHQSYYAHFLPRSFHSLPPARDQSLADASESSACFQSASSPPPPPTHAEGSALSLSAVASPTSPYAPLHEADVGRLSLPASLPHSDASESGDGVGGGLALAGGLGHAAVWRGPAGATPAPHAALRPNDDDADARAAAAAAAAAVAGQSGAQLYDEEDPFQTRAAGEAAAAAAVRAAREAALAVSLHVAASQGQGQGQGDNRGGSGDGDRDGSGARAGFSSSSSRWLDRSMGESIDEQAEEEGEEEEDSDGEVLVRAASSVGSGSVESRSASHHLLAASSGDSFADSPSSLKGAGSNNEGGGGGGGGNEITVSLDCDDLTQPSTLVDVVAGGGAAMLEEDGEAEEKRRKSKWSFGRGGRTGHRRPRTRHDSHGDATQLSCVLIDSDSAPGCASVSPQVRSDPTSAMLPSHHAHDVLYVSPAPFSQPERGGGAHDSYSLMGDSPTGSSGWGAGVGVHRSRHIAHPKSLSYRPGSGVLRAALGAAGIAHADEEADDGAFGPRAAAAAVAKRREALARKNATHGSHAASSNSSGRKSGGSGGARPGSIAIPAPRIPAAGGTVPSSFTLRQLDPNASPVRSRVKFADSPRDRQRASLLLAATATPTALKGGEWTGPDHAASALVPTQQVGLASSAPFDAGQTSVAASSPPVRRTLKSLLKREVAPAAPAPSVAVTDASAPSWSLLVLPVYKRLLLLQVAHCVLWASASLVLLGFGTNLVEWRTGMDGQGGGGGGGGPEGDEEGDGSLSQPGWVFSLTLGVLMGVQAAVLDGLLVFLAARNVGRSYIRFSMVFAAAWGLVTAVVVLVVSLTAHHDSHSGVGLPPSHPFFVRSCMALGLNLFILLSPRCCVCDGRARRSNRGQRPQSELVAALERRQRRWDTYADETDTFDSDPDLYADGSEPRQTWMWLGMVNIAFHILVVVAFSIGFSGVFSSSAGDGGDDGNAAAQRWEWAILALLALGFVGHTPLLYACLLADSRHWQREWLASLTRMKAEVAAEEAERKQRRERAVADLRSRGMEAEARAIEDAAASSSSSLADFEGGDHHGDEGGFFIPAGALKYGALLGSGGFSSVYAARLGGRSRSRSRSRSSKSKTQPSDRGLDVAVKVLHVRDLSAEVVSLFAHEVSIVLRLRHPNVVRFLGVVFSPPDMVLVMARCRAHSLLDLIRDQRVRFSEFQAVSIGLAIADGLRYMHERDIVHRDLKSANILFDASGRPQICDFGLSQQRSKIDLAHVFAGTLAYMSPETLRSETVGKYSDVYSFAIVLWELLHNKLAWKRGRGKGINARLLVEMVAYKRARPPLKARVVEAANSGSEPSRSTGEGSHLQSQSLSQRHAHTPLAIDAARIDAQVFAADGGAAHPHASTGHSGEVPDAEVVGIHPALIQLLREMWRDDYLRRPNFSQIVKRLSAWREEMRARRRAHHHATARQAHDQPPAPAAAAVL